MNILVACGVYIGAMIAANLSVYTWGPVVAPVNAFLFIGLDLTLRDKLSDAWGVSWRMPALIVASSVATYLLNPAAGQIALASAVAFAVSSVVDWGAYTALRGRAYMTRVNGSNMAGALADSLIFPTLAFGGFMPGIVAVQFAAKVSGGFVWALVIKKVKL